MKEWRPKQVRRLPGVTQLVKAGAKVQAISVRSKFYTLSYS